MKNIILTSILISLIIPVFSQGLNFEVRGTNGRTLTQTMILKANTMSDINPGYPSTWISEYIGTEISIIGEGKARKAVGKNEILSDDQKDLLHNASLGDNIIVDVDYKVANAIRGMENRHMHFELTLTPEIQAQFPGGHQDLSAYLEDNAIYKISEEASRQMDPAIIRFTVTETGEISNAHVLQSSKIPDIDKLLLEAINKMPKWKPAENSNGLKLKQEFEFTVGSGGC